jgi:dTMP kinase
LSAFVVFEGGDGAGKSTHARTLHRSLSGEGIGAVLTREPGGTPLGNAIRRWLKTQPHRTPVAELLLFSAARTQHVSELIAPALESGRVVICDRFTASTVAYQGYGRGLDLELIRDLNDRACQGIRPDLTVLLDVPWGEGLARKHGNITDPFETETMEFHRRVREGYLAQASAEPDRWFIVDGTRPKREVAEEIWGRVRLVLRG